MADPCCGPRCGQAGPGPCAQGSRSGTRMRRPEDRSRGGADSPQLGWPAAPGAAPGPGTRSHAQGEGKYSVRPVGLTSPAGLAARSCRGQAGGWSGGAGPIDAAPVYPGPGPGGGRQLANGAGPNSTPALRGGRASRPLGCLPVAGGVAGAGARSGGPAARRWRAGGALDGRPGYGRRCRCRTPPCAGGTGSYRRVSGGRSRYPLRRTGPAVAGGTG
jgi:hypothetical protein